MTWLSFPKRHSSVCCLIIGVVQKKETGLTGEIHILAWKKKKKKKKKKTFFEIVISQTKQSAKYIFF